jgi:hypothetical protein
MDQRCKEISLRGTIANDGLLVVQPTDSQSLVDESVIVARSAFDGLLHGCSAHKPSVTGWRVCNRRTQFLWWPRNSSPPQAWPPRKNSTSTYREPSFLRPWNDEGHRPCLWHVSHVLLAFVTFHLHYCTMAQVIHEALVVFPMPQMSSGEASRPFSYCVKTPRRLPLRPLPQMKKYHHPWQSIDVTC